MKKKVLGYLALLLIVSVASNLSAEETKNLEEINVNETTVAPREDLELSSPTNLYQIEKSAQFGTEVMDEKEIEAYQAKDFFDLMNKAIGMDVTYQGRKHPYFINMRGGGSITYILDGAILPSTSDRILTTLPLVAIEEIQIVRTSTAITIAPAIDIGASNSGGGTSIGYIIIRTKHPKKTGGMLRAYYEQADAQPGADGEDLYMGATFGSANSLNGYVGGMVSRYNRPSREDWFDGSSAQAGMINAGLNYGPITINTMAYKDRGRFEMQRGVKTDGTVDNAKWFYDPIITTVLSMDGNIIWSENQVTLFSASSIMYEQTEINDNFANTSHAQKEYTESTQTYSLRHKARFGNTLINLGGQMTHSKGFGPNLSKGYNKYDTSVMGYAISLEQSLFDESLVLDAGYRLDYKHIKDSTKAKNEALSKPNANNNIDLSPANVIAVGALWNMTNTYSLSARYYYGDEGVSGDFDLMTENNETLHAEKQNRWEVGLKADFDKVFVPMITYFDVDIENEKTAIDDKTYTDDQGNEYYYYTEQNSHRQGVELSINGTIKRSTTYKFSWTRMLLNETSNSTTSSDSVGVSTPENSYSALISHTWEDYRFNASAKRVDAYSSSSSAMGTSSGVTLGNYTRIDANAAKDFKWKSNIITGKIYGRNLTNDKYATRYTTGYYYDRGRTLGVEISMNF